MAISAAPRRSKSSALALALAAAAAVAAPAAFSWCTAGPPRAPLPRTTLLAEPEFAEPGNSVGDGGTTPLMLAAHRNDAEEVKNFAVVGANLNGQDEYGWTALRYAVRDNNGAAARALVELGADLDLPSASGRTPLMSAAGNGISEMVELLLSGGADKSLKDKDGKTAYDISLRGGPTGCQKCQELLKA